jgi:hypothetical protein
MRGFVSTVPSSISLALVSKKYRRGFLYRYYLQKARSLIYFVQEDFIIIKKCCY